MHLIIVGLSHKTAPVALREGLSVPEGESAGLLKKLLEHEDVLEAMLVSTCNRVEVCIVARHEERGITAAREVLAGVAGLSEEGAHERLTPHLYEKKGGEAVAHLFRVTAGLDSMVVGESQIRGQVKTAYTEAVAANATGTYLNKLIHRSMRVSKRVRTETGIGRNPVSVSSAAVLLAEKIFGDLQKKAVLVIGAGEMSELVVQYLQDRGVSRIFIANRSRDRAAELVGRFGGEAIGLDQVSDFLEKVDVVISSVESPSAILLSESVQRAMGTRKGRAMFFIDIGVPRNIDPAVNRIENVYLYNIDDLRGIVESNIKEREREAERAETIISDEVASFLRYMKEREVSPTIQQLAKKFDRIRTRELGRYFKNGAVSPKQREEIEACTQAIVNKILHDPIILMKTEQLRDEGPRYSEILRKLFRLEGE